MNFLDFFATVGHLYKGDNMTGLETDFNKYLDFISTFESYELEVPKKRLPTKGSEAL